jgi:alkylated DNA repair dioxygenase AlkB
LTWPAKDGKQVNNQPDLDLLCFEPFVPRPQARQLFEFLRSELPFYRVEYKIKRGGFETEIKTPRYDYSCEIATRGGGGAETLTIGNRWTTVFGIDDTSKFSDEGIVIDSKSEVIVSDRRYDQYPPRPIPTCLDMLRRSTEAVTGCKFNFCLVNYYASGADSISYHSDDERFLGPEPAIASFSLGAQRDFLLKSKTGSGALKMPLGSGDMVLMRGRTQSQWLHSIPKRTGKNAEDGGRINITFRRAVTKDGTENYYNYNVGSGPVYTWDKSSREMRKTGPEIECRP